MKKLPYTKNNRISDVIRLIQYLGLDKEGKYYYPELNAAKEALGFPASDKNNSWLSIAKQHGEFFVVTDSKAIALATRILKRERKEEVCSYEEIKMLTDIALHIYQIQLEHSRAWKFWLPAIVAFIIGLLSSGLLKFLF